jgi:hypothetical protein
MCNHETNLGRFRVRDNKMTRIVDTAAPEDFTIPEKESSASVGIDPMDLPADEFRTAVESGDMAKRGRDAMETFVQASNARWAKPKGEESNQTSGRTPFGKNLSADPSSLSPTPGERYESTPTTDSSAKRFIAASKARWAKK